MANADQPNGNPAIITLHTERLKLRLAHPDNDADMQAVLDMYLDLNGGKGGNNRIGIHSAADVREKNRVCGPRAELCTLAPPPYGIFFLMYLSSPSSPSNDDAKDELVGHIGMSFRPEMPYPDLGYGLRAEFERKGLASEAGRRVVEWWRDEIGVKEIWCGTLPGNERSQNCARRIGFVQAGTVDVVFGNPPDETDRITGGVAFVLPGMVWKDGLTIYPTIH